MNAVCVGSMLLIYLLVLFAFALGGLFTLPLPFFLLHWKACHISILAAAAVCMQDQARTCPSPKLHKTPLCIADDVLACVARTTRHRPVQAIIYTTRLATCFIAMIGTLLQSW